ncbi:hypothetical protein MRX96_010613 [Rhipicephalus microplus]
MCRSLAKGLRSPPRVFAVSSRVRTFALSRERKNRCAATVRIVSRLAACLVCRFLFCGKSRPPWRTPGPVRSVGGTAPCSDRRSVRDCFGLASDLGRPLRRKVVVRVAITFL